MKLFRDWYNSGKPGATTFHKMITEYDPFLGNKPTAHILGVWMKGDWKEAAEQLDNQVGEQIEANMIAEKVQILERHAVVGKKMQDMALAYLEENGVGSSRNAIELLVKGLEIERISVGAPKIAAKLMDMTDEQLLQELRELASGSPVVDTQPNS